MTPEQRKQMGRKGREYYERHFDKNGLLDQLCRFVFMDDPEAGRGVE